MNVLPLVSVVIPSYNHAQYIDAAIESVYLQTYGNFEIIVVDDGSVDGTSEVLQKYLGRERIQIILNASNRGQSAVVNQALKIANGEYIGFLPSDDWLLPEKLEMQVAKFAELGSQYGVVYGKGQRYYEDTGETLDVDLPMHSGWVLRELINGNFVYPVTPLFRRECFDVFPFDESYSAEGEAIYLKLATRYKFGYVDAVVGVMRDHTYNTGKAYDLMHAENLRYWGEFFARPELPVEISRLKGWRLSKLYRQSALIEVSRGGDAKKARAMIRESIMLHPRNLADWRIVAAYFLTLQPAGMRAFIIRAFGKGVP